MKRLFVSLLFGSFLLGSPASYASPSKTDEISLRIRAVNSHLAGIISDTITDMLWNPARLPSKSFVSFYVPNRIVTSLPGPLKTRWGILLEGSYRESENEYRETKPFYYWDYHYTDYLSSSSSCYSSNTYRGVLLGSKQVNPNTSIGLRLDYSLRPYKSSSNRIYRHTRERNYDSYEWLDSRDDTGERNSADTTSSYSLTIGTLSSIWKSDLEIVLRYRNQKEIGHFLDSRGDSRYEEYTRTSDSTTHTNIHNSKFERLADEYNHLNPQIWSLGLRLSRDITPASTFRTIATFYKGHGDAQRERKNMGYYYRDSYYSYSDPDTSYARGDTSESYREDESVLDGDADILGGFLALGQEFTISPQLSGGIGIRISYERSKVNFEGSKDEVYDTSTSHSMVEEIDIERRTYIYLPMGVEYRPIPEFAIRGGVNLCGSYRFSEESTNGEYNRLKYTKGPDYDLSFGIGYNWRRFKFDIYTMDIAALWSWNIEVGYSF